MKKRILSLLLVLSMLMGLVAVMPLSVSAAETITIANESDWLALCGTTVDGKNVTVTAKELDFSKDTVTPITFKNGTFDGQGVLITGVTMDLGGDAALFCGISNATIKNIVIDDSSFTVKKENGGDGNWVAALACCGNTCTIENIYVKDGVYLYSEYGYAGGILGGITGSSNTVTIRSCIFAGTMEAASTAKDCGCGGILGNSNSASSKKHDAVIEYCLVTGRVPNNVNKSSGFVGTVENSTSKPQVTLTSCIYAGGAEDDYFYNRPFGHASVFVVTDCYTTHTAVNGVYNNVKYTATGSGVQLIERSSLEGANAIQIDGFKRMADGIMIPKGIANYLYPVADGEITFKNWDGTVLQTGTCEGGLMPEYTGATPTKPDSKFYTYEFAGWTPSIDIVNGSAEYIADFTETLKTEAPAEVDGKYVINNVNQYLYFMKNASDFNGETIVIGTDLDFEGADDILEPITGFTGTFDGNYKTISNLHMSGSGDVALFCDVGDGAAFKNLVFKSSSFTVDKNWVAPLACCGTGNYTVNNIYVGKDVVITAGKDGNNSYAGGIIGGMNGSDNVVLVDGCVFAGTVNTEANYAAGIVGNIYADHPNVVISNCLNIGTINCGGIYAAGIATLNSGNVENCVNAGTVTGNDYVAGIAAGNPAGEEETSVTGCYTVGDVFAFNSKNGGTYTEENNTGDVRVNAFVGTNASVTIEGWTKRDGDIMVPAGVASVVEAWYVAPELRGEGTAQSPYLIGSADEWEILVVLASDNNKYLGKYITLDADIDFDGVNVSQLSGFAGTFDGNYYAIKNLTLSGTGDVGLFCSLADGAVLKNLVIKSSTITANKNWVGALACCAGGDVTIQNIYVDKDVTVTAKVNEGDTAYAGGILGGVYGSGNTVVVDNCVFAGTVIAKGDYAAGIVGNVYDENNVTIQNCLNAGRVESTKNYAAGIATAMGVNIQNCVNVGVVKGSNYVGGIYAGNPKTVPVVLTSCYSVGTAVGYNADGGEVPTVTDVVTTSYGKLIGSNATVPASFTKRAGDFAVPANVNAYVPTLLTQQLYDGAAVRLSAPTGIRFTAILGADFLNALKANLSAENATFGIIIAPTDYVTEAGAFNLAAFDALGLETPAYVIVPAEQLLSGGAADGYYEFTGVLANIKTQNYNRDFSAIAYVEINGEYYYSAYSETNNSRSIAYVAQKAYEDTNYEQTDYYDDELKDQAGVFSPYTSDQRNLLLTFFNKEATDIHFLSYNIRNVEDTSGWLDSPTFEYTNRNQYVVDYLIEYEADIIGLQEVSRLRTTLGTLDWFDTLQQLENAGYVCYKGSDILANDADKDMYNPIYYKADTFELVASGMKWLTATPDVCSTIDGADTTKALTYVVLRHKTTGEEFVYVNVHLIVRRTNYVHDSEGNDTEHYVQELEVIYLRAILDEIQSEYDLPMFVGGDFNNSYSGINTWFKESVVGENDWDITTGTPTESIKLSIARDKAVSKAPKLYSCTTEDFTEINPEAVAEDWGAIDLWFTSNFDGVVHCYQIIDNYNEAVGKYPSDHLPAKFYVTLYSEKTN